MKAVFVDGASLFHMGRAVGLRKGVNFTGLYDLLAGLGEEKRFAEMPLVVLSPTAAALKKPFTGAGFDVEMAESKNGSDDQVIIERIKTLDVDKVKEVVLVSADSDYIPVLKFKIMEGLSEVYWVATDAVQGRRSGMGRDLKRLLKAPGFHFVELADHKEALRYGEEAEPALSESPVELQPTTV